MKVVSKFSNDKCTGVVLADDDGWIIKVKGQCGNQQDCGKILKYSASAPADFRQSRAGSGLPYPNKDIAYGASTNNGEVRVESNGTFEFDLVYPNAYYINNGSTLVAPHVHFSIGDGTAYDLKLGSPFVENRSLKHLYGRPRRSHQH